MKSLARILAIFKKDFLDCLRSRTVVFTLLTPIILSLMFSIVFSGTDTVNLKMAVFDRGKSGFYDFLKGAPSLEVIKSQNEAELRALVLDGKAQAGVIIPYDFDLKIKGKEIPSCQYIEDDTALRQADAIRILLIEILHSYAGQNIPARMNVERAHKSKIDKKQEFVIVWTLFTIIGGLMIVTSSLIEEKEKKTLAAIRVTPAKFWEILTGKAGVGILLTLAGALLILLLNRTPLENLPAVFGVLIMGAVTFSLVGLLVGLLSPGHTVASSIGSILYILFFMPVVLSDASKSMKVLASILPSFYVLDGMNKAIFASAGAGSLIFHFIYMAVISIILFFACTVYISKAEQS
ncbi:MAG: ABC transporter permease [Firmicutes bacterium]|nr:ABC transporter permease [Bacillota bacterium]